MFAATQVVRIPARDIRMVPITDHRYRKAAPVDNLPGIVVVTTLLGDIEVFNVLGWISV